ncbi:Cu2+-exporting ATPase/Cu+-exporting ATPase [Halomonas campaniensis]|uniref:Cu2+-exporting ATPase/Cu+-exporting ATPase n=1 Tax=Halomonas campaniensis TaxID=213554 RepID=A0A7W5K5S5_9GAMM|nr:cation-translocating P-type ATPase [Halomonas campaniensis]MBB3331922.1 Cu2+-exporting ATPase/Cu+-exporting ATPase [Halomonas campaniensis]
MTRRDAFPAGQQDAATLAGSPATETAALEGERLLRSVEGMWCTSCALAIEHRLGRLPGVSRAGVDYLSATLMVEGTPAAVAPERIAAAVGRLGYRLCDLESAPDARQRLDAESRALAGRLLAAALFGMWTMLASLLIYAGALPEARLERVLAWVSGAFALPVVTLATWPFYRAAWRTLRAGRPGMDALVSLGVIGALAVSVWLLGRGSAEVYFDTAVMLVLLLLAGRWVETLARYRGLRALEGLAPLPERACRLDPRGEDARVPVAEVAAGERIRVARGETLALDGELLDAAARLDLALLTGESRPRTLTRGSRLSAGCRNLGAPFTLRVTAGVGERRLDGLYRQVQALQAGKGELRRLAERFAAWLSPAALALALVTLASLLLAGVAPEEAAVRALSVLVVACPCAVGLAVPLASLAGTSRALEAGVVFRDPAALELAGQVRAVAFDKTGTLTRGALRLAALGPVPGVAERDLLALAARAEWGSEHPLGLAIRAAAAEAGIAPGQAPAAVSEHPGRGRETREADGTSLRIGAPDWLAGQDAVPAWRKAGPPWATEVAVARDGQWLGILWLEDDPEPGAAATLAGLREQGLMLAMISGDRPVLVRRLGRRLGLAPEACFGGRSPEAKRHLVAALPGPVLYVGDGINDAPALAASTVGVASAEASAGARDAAAIQLLGHGVQGVPAAIAIARATRRVMRQNLALSALYNALALGLAGWMVIPPQAAVLAMVASSLSVVGNAARLGLAHPGTSKAMESRLG